MADLGSLLGSVGIGGAIGKAIVSLELDTKKYTAEMKAAQGQTVASTNAMGQSVSKFGALGKQAFLAVGIAAVAGLAYSVKAAIEANDALLKLQNTFQNNAKLSDSSVEAFAAQAEAIQLLTGSSDEAILTAQALLGQFNVTGKEVMTLTPLIVDLSEKMGIEMTAAAKSVGKAVIGNTAGLQRYGIVIEEASGKGGEFDAVLKGLEGTVGGFAEQRGQEEPWRILAAQFDELAEGVGNALIPILKNLTNILLKLGPVLNFAGEHAEELLLALAGFAAIKWLPGLLGSIAGGFQGLGLALAGVSVGGGFLGNLGAIVGALPQIALNAPMAAAGIVEVWESLHPQENFATPIIEANVALSALSESAQADLAFIAMHFEDAGRSAESFQGNIDRINEALAEAGIEYVLTVGALERLVEGQSIAGLGASQLAEAQEIVAAEMDKAGNAARKLGFQSKAAFRDFKEGVEDSVEVGIGEFEKLGDAFDTTPKELQKALDLAIQIARREQRVLREIFADDSLTKAQKTALAELPANMRDAWSEAGKAGKQQIEKDAVELKNLNSRNFREITRAAQGPAKEGGRQIGAAVMEGAKQGVDAGAEGLKDAVRTAVANAIRAGKEEAGAQSPSKVMRELGLDMMEGLYQGITSGAQKVIDAARKGIEKLISQISSQLDKVKGMASEFAGTISGAIGGFGDIGSAFGSAEEGMSLSSVIATQLGGAQALADVLEALKRQGASRATLSQVAETGTAFGQAILQGGPEQIREMNQALADIAALAKETGKGLSEKFFGQEIARLEKRLEKQNDQLRELVELERLGHSHAIILNGQKVSEAVRDELIKTGKRNDGTGID